MIIIFFNLHKYNELQCFYPGAKSILILDYKCCHHVYLLTVRTCTFLLLCNLWFLILNIELFPSASYLNKAIIIIVVYNKERVDKAREGEGDGGLK